MANWLPRDLRDDFEADNYEAQAAQIISGATERIKQATQAASDTVSGAVQGATSAAQTATSGVGDVVRGLVAAWQDDDEQPQQPTAPTLAGSWEDPTAPRPVRTASGTPVGMPTAPRRALPSTGEELADPVITQGGNGLRAWARQEARRLGIDPDIAERVAMSEGGFDNPARQSNVINPQGEREQSYGPYQLNVTGGLGNQAIARGIDPRNPAHARAAVTFALEHAARNGWGAFHGAAGVGIGQWDGIGQAPVQSARMAAPSRVEHSAGGTPITAPEQMYSAGDLTPNQYNAAKAEGLDDETAWAVCGPAAAIAFARRMGRNPTMREAVGLARQVGWTAQAGMAGPASQQRLLEGLGVAARLEQGAPDWKRVAADVQRGNPVIISTSGHYFVAERFDPETGAFDFGNSAMVLRASGGRRWFKPEELANLGMGEAHASLYLDNPGSPQPSVVAGRTSQQPSQQEQPVGIQRMPRADGQDDTQDMQRAPLSVGERLAQSWSDEPIPEDAAEGGLRVRAKYDAVPDLSQQPDDPDRGPREATPGSVGSQPLPQTDQNYPMRYGEVDTSGRMFGPEEPEDTIESRAGEWVRGTALPAVQSAAGAMFDPDRPRRVVQEAAHRWGMRWEPRTSMPPEAPDTTVDPNLPHGQAISNRWRAGWTVANASMLDAAAEHARMLGMPRAADAFEEWANDVIQRQDRGVWTRRTRDALDGPFGIVESVVESAPSLLPTVLGAILAAGGAATGNPALLAAGTGVARAGLAMGGASAFGQQARELRGEVAQGRMSQATANAVAIGAGLVEIATEKLFPGIDAALARGMAHRTARRMLADLREKGLVAAGKKILTEAGQEAVEEAVAESYGVAVDSVFKEKAPTLAQAARRIAAAGVTGAASGAAVTGAMQGVEAAADRAARQRVGEDVRGAGRETLRVAVEQAMTRGWIPTLRAIGDTTGGTPLPGMPERTRPQPKIDRYEIEDAARLIEDTPVTDPGQRAAGALALADRLGDTARERIAPLAKALAEARTPLARRTANEDLQAAIDNEIDSLPWETDEDAAPTEQDDEADTPLDIKAADLLADGANERKLTNDEAQAVAEGLRQRFPGREVVVEPLGRSKTRSMVRMQDDSGAMRLVDNEKALLLGFAATERESGPPSNKYEHSSTQLDLPKPVAEQVRKYAKNAIRDEDLAEDGREESPHVTVKYGLTAENADEVRAIVERHGPITLRMGKTSIFPASESGSADVVKVDVDSPELRALNAELSKLPNADRHPTYKPHLTLAYVKPGRGRKYSGSKEFDGKTVTIDALTFSGKNGEQVSIPLRGAAPVGADTGAQPSAPTTAPTSAQATATPAGDERDERMYDFLKERPRTLPQIVEARGPIKAGQPALYTTNGGKQQEVTVVSLRGKTGSGAMVRFENGREMAVPTDRLAPIAGTPAPAMQDKPVGMEGKGEDKARWGDIDDDELRRSLTRTEKDSKNPYLGKKTQARLREQVGEIRAELERRTAKPAPAGKQPSAPTNAPTSNAEDWDAMGGPPTPDEAAEIERVRERRTAALNGRNAKVGDTVQNGDGKTYTVERADRGGVIVVTDADGNRIAGPSERFRLTAEPPQQESAPAAPSGGTLEAEDGERDGRAGADGSPGRAGATREPAEPRAATGAQRPAPRVRGDEGAVGPQPGEDAGGAQRPRSVGGRERSVQGTRPELTDAPARKPTETGQSPAPSPLSAGQDAVFDPKDDALREKSAPRRFDRNLEALELLAKLEAEQRPATAAEQKILSRYSGFGDTGFNEAFPGDGEPKPGIWATRRNRLKAALNALYPGDQKAGERAFKSVERSRPNAMYTTPEVIAAMWRGLERMGVGNLRRPRVLEPSSGSGRFVGLMPSDVAAKAQKALVELDDATGRLARKLFPASFVQVTGFQDAVLPDNGFDVAISNVPFSEVGVLDRDWPRSMAHLQKPLHNYFFAKALDKVRPGGVIAFVTSRYTMDGTDATAVAFREHMAEHADLVAAVRLPSGAFPDTKVTTDIIFLQKRDPKDGPGDTTWVGTTEQSVETEYDFKTWTGSVEKRTTTTKFNLNNYYVENPSNVLGEHAAPKSGGLYGGFEYTVSMSDTKWLARLNRIMGRLPQDALRESVAPAPALSDMQQTAYAARQRPGGYYIGEDGKLMIARLDGRRVTPEPANLPATAEKRVRGMLGIRDRTQRLLELQSQGAKDADIGAAQHDLAAAYDPFVKTYGPLNARENAALMRTDPDAGLLRSLEQWSERIAKEFPSRPSKADIDGLKAPIFTKRVTAMGTRPERADSPSDAMMIALNETGTLDWDRMASLTGRTPEQLQEALLGEGLVYENPEGGYETADAYLSGPVRVKLRKAEAAARADERFQRNVDALKSVVPEDLEPGEIVVGLGAPWVPVAYLNAFARDVLGLYSLKPGERAIFEYLPERGGYVQAIADNDISSTSAKDEEWATPYFSTLELLEKALAGKTPVAYDKVDDRRVQNEPQTQLAKDKIDKIRERFSEWVWEDPQRAADLAEIYNDTLNGTVAREYDGSHLTFPGANPEIKLRPHQKNAVWRIIQDGTVLLAHEVGFGKTFEMIAAGMELRRLGLSKRNLYVVKNGTLEQFVKDFRKLYPQAKLLVEDETLTRAKRGEFMARIATGDWDGVVIQQSKFTLLPVKEETHIAYAEARIKELRAAILARRQAGDTRDVVQKQLQKAIDNEEIKVAKLRKALEGRQDNAIYFEDLGIDTLFVDEADLYRRLPFVTKKERIKGIPTSTSQRAPDMEMKARIVSRRNGGRGVVFATGTPISNSIAEVWVMMKYLMPEKLEAMGFGHFDAWADTFGELEFDFVPNPAGVYQPVTAFASFRNLPEMARLWQSVADVMMASDAPEMVKRQPKLVGGERTGDRIIVKSPRTQALVDAMQSFQERLNAIKANRKAFQPPQKGDDTELAVYTAARMAAVDVRMVNPRAPEDPNGKLAKATENIYQIWRDEARDKGTQLVFLDIGTPKPPRPVKEEEEGSPDEDDPTKRDTLTDEERRLAQAVYTRLKDRLVAKGIPAREIALATEPKNKAEFETLMEKVRTGEIRVLIGSTEKMGAGVNVQDRLAALHHVNAPWNPRDIEQREGRIIRQGNRVYGPVVDENDNVKDEGRGVRIYQYVAVGSFDERSWQTLLRKARGIKQLMRRHVTERQIEDMGSLVESFETAKAASSGRPEAVRLVKVMNELDKVGAIRQAWQSGQRTARLEMQRLPAIIDGDEQYLAAVQADAKTLAENPEARAVIGGKTVEGSTAINGTALAAITKAEQQGEDTEIGTYRGLKIRVAFAGQFFPHLKNAVPAVKLALRGRDGYGWSTFPVSALGEAGAVDAAARLRNLAGMVADRLKAAEKYLEDHRAKLKVYDDRLNKPFEYEQRYQSLLRERTQLEEILAKPAEEGPTVEDGGGEQVDAGIAEPAWTEPNHVPDVGDYTEGQMRPITRDELVALAFGEVEPRAPVAQTEAAAPEPEPEPPAIEAPAAEEEQADAEPDAEPAAVAEAAGEGVPEMSPAAGEETAAAPAPAEATPEPAPVAPTTQTEQIVSAIDALKAAILGEPTPAPAEAAPTPQELPGDIPGTTRKSPGTTREGQRAPSSRTAPAAPESIEEQQQPSSTPPQADNTAAEPSAPSAPSADETEKPAGNSSEPETLPDESFRPAPEQPSEDVRREQAESRLPVLASMFEEVTPEAIGSFLPEDAPEGMALAIFERLVDDGKVSEDGQVIEGEVIPPDPQQTPPPNDQQAGPQVIDGTVVSGSSRPEGQQQGQRRTRARRAAGQQPPAGATPPQGPPQPPTPPPPTTGDNPNAEHPDESGDAANAALGKQFRASMKRDSKRLSPGMLEAIRRAYVRAMTDDRIDLNMLVEEIEREHGPLPAEFRVDLLARMSPGMAAKVKIDEGLKPHLRGLSEADLAWLDVFLTHMDNLDVAKAMGLKAEQESIDNAGPFRGKSWRKLQEERQRLRAFEPGGIAENPQKAAASAKRVKELERQVRRDEVRHQQKVMARAAKRRNTVESERLFSEGLTVADSRRALGALARELGPQRLAKIQKAAVGVWEFNRSLLKAKVDNDVISQELYDELVRLYPHYVPTRIVDFIKDPEKDGGPAVGKSLSLNDQGLRRNTLEGTSRRRENPLASTYRNAIETERIIKQNQVALAMKLLIESDPDGLGQEFREAPEGHKLRDGEGYVAGFDKGKRFRYVTGEPMARALKVVSVSPVHPMLRAFMNFWKELITRFPLFWAYQSVQDASTYEMREQSRASGNPLSLAAALADLAVGYAISFRGILSGEYKGSAAEYLKSGGGMAGISMRDVDTAKERVYDLRRRNVFEIRGPRDIARLIRNGVLFDWSQAISERIEMAPRVASYRRAQRRGKSEVEAVVAGRDVTLDFLRGGYLARYLNGLLGFFNVGAQASASIPRMWRENPRGFVIMASMWLAAGALIEAAMGGDDDEWEDLPKNLKDRGFLFPSGGVSTTEEGERRPRFFMLPMRELAPLLIPAREAVRRYQGKEGRDLLEVALATLMAASPIQSSGPSDFFGTAYPEILATPAQLAMDYDWFRGGPIKTKRNDEQASTLAKGIANALQFLGDRNESLRGLGTVTPAQVEFLGRGYGGHFARTVGAASDVGRDRGKQDRGPMDTPLVGGLINRFVTDAGGERLRVAQQERNLIALDVRRQLREARVNVTIGTVRGTIEGVPLHRGEQARYQELANRYTDRELRALLRDGEFKSARGAARAKLVQQAIARGREEARQRVIDRIPFGEQERRKRAAEMKAAG